MKKFYSILRLVGFLIVIGYLLFDRFVQPLPNNIGIPILVIGILMLVIGNILYRTSRDQNK